MPSLANENFYPVIPARYQTQSLPDNNTPVLSSAGNSTVRVFVSFVGTVTAVTLRLWLYNARTGTWFKGSTSADFGAIAPGDGNSAFDLFVGKNAQFTLTVESISPGTSGNTVSVDVTGVQS